MASLGSEIDGCLSRSTPGLQDGAGVDLNLRRKKYIFFILIKLSVIVMIETKIESFCKTNIRYIQFISKIYIEYDFLVHFYNAFLRYTLSLFTDIH